MSFKNDPFDADTTLSQPGCSCGAHRNAAEHNRAVNGAMPEGDDQIRRSVEGAVMRALFRSDIDRRNFLRTVGASTALAAISQFFPLKFATEVFAEGGPIEKKDLKVGFIPITCATPIIMAHPMGFYE